MVDEQRTAEISEDGNITLKRNVTFQDDPFLLDLTTEGATWWGKAPTDTLVVAAVLGRRARDWCAYSEDPYWGPKRVAELGNKLPEEAARRLFPLKPWCDLPYRR